MTMSTHYCSRCGTCMDGLVCPKCTLVLSQQMKRNSMLERLAWLDRHDGFDSDRVAMTDTDLQNELQRREEALAKKVKLSEKIAAKPEEYGLYEKCPKCQHAFISEHETHPPRHVELAYRKKQLAKAHVLLERAAQVCLRNAALTGDELYTMAKDIREWLDK